MEDAAMIGQRGEGIVYISYKRDFKLSRVRKSSSCHNNGSSVFELYLISFLNKVFIIYTIKMRYFYLGP